jgi:hypothetical protein
VAADSLIDRYVTAFGQRVRSRTDRQDLIDEVRDHLLSAVERLQSLGVDHESAERRALARFGEPRLVASLLTAVPSKGSIMSLFFSRYLAALAALAAAAWIAATIASLYGHTDLFAPWTQEAYLRASVIIGIACLATTAVLIGLNVRAVGRLDGQTVAIAVVGVLAAVAAGLLSWFIAVWMPLLAVAVTWTLVRAWRNHAGSRVFAIAMIVVLPLVAVLTIGLTVLDATLPRWNAEPVAWALYCGMIGLLLAGLVDLTVRLAHRAVSARVVTA